MSEREKSMQDPDEFWDLASLVPPRRRPAPPRTAHSATVETVEVTSPPRSTGEATGQTADVPLTERFVPPHTARDLLPKEEPERRYTPVGSLVREVRVYPWRSRYDYYEQFASHAARLADKEGTPCPEVDFFSYMPQYVQMNRAQLAYYLWWRTSFRRGTCLPAAYSYLLLYLYELINLDEKHQNPKTGQENMLRLWLSYREKYPRLDALLREWLCDYSLLHELPPPRLDPTTYRALLCDCRLKEFYVPADGDGEALAGAILLFCNNYDYTKSKFYRPETAADYDRVLGGAIRVAIAHLREESGTALTDAEGVSTVTRDSFSGSICSWRLKRRIEVDYTSFSYTHELRYIMTDVLKYAENALRGALGIKSRLSVYALSAELRARLDVYLAAALPLRQPRQTVRRESEVPAYERQYDLPVTEISPERAAAIEAESWQTTKRLVEAFAEPMVEDTEREPVEKFTITPQTGAENTNFQEPSSPVEVPAPAPAATPASPLATALAEWIGFLRAALAADRTAQREEARKLGLMPDAVADKINTVAGDMLGDILLEEENGTYTVIEDYRSILNDEGVI